MKRLRICKRNAKSKTLHFDLYVLRDTNKKKEIQLKIIDSTSSGYQTKLIKDTISITTARRSLRKSCAETPALI